MKVNIEEVFKKKLPETKGETSLRQRIAVKALVGFFIIMLALTVLSKLADSIIVPKVKVMHAKGGYVKHISEFMGTVETKEDIQIEAKEGLTVEKVFVEEGQKVNPGDPLIKLNMEEIESQMKSIQRDIEKLEIQKKQLTLQSLESGTGDLVENAKLALEYIKEDKTFEIQQIDEKIKRIENEVLEAKQTLLDAQEKLESFMASNLEGQIAKAKEEVEAAKKNVEKQQYEQEKALKRAEQDIEEVRKQISVTEGDVTMLFEQLERAEMEYEITKEDWKRNVQVAKEELVKAQEKLKKLEAGEVDQIMVEAEQSKVNAAKEAVKAKEKELEDMQYNKEQTIVKYDREILEAERKIVEAEKESTKENAQQEKDEMDNSLNQQALQVDIEAKEEELAKLSEIKASNNILVAPESGMVNAINIKKGEKTSTETLMTLLSDKTQYVFEAEVNAEEVKAVEVGDSVKITLAGESEPIKEQTVIENIINLRGEKQGNKKIIVSIPKGVPGTKGTLVIEKESERYDYIIPEVAINEDSQGKYVLVARSQVTTLGEQIVAERVDVKVLDQNGEVAGVQGALSGKDQVIIKTNKPIQAGDRVRLLEQ